MSVIDLSMSSPVSSPPPSPKPGSSKRKAEAGQDHSPEKGKKAKTSDSAEDNPKKLLFSQDIYSRTLPGRAVHKFESWLWDAKDEGTQPTEIPQEFYKLIAIAGHEMSSSSEITFLKHIKAELFKLVKPELQDILTNDLLTPLVTKLFTLKHYGYKPSDFGVTRIPAALQVRRWEVNDLDKYFPTESLPELVSRRQAREQHRQTVETQLAGMDDVEKNEFLKGDKSDKDDKKDDKPEASTSSAVPTPSRGRATRDNSVASSRTRSVSPVKRGKKLTPAEEEEARKRKEEKEKEKDKRKEEKEKLKEEKEAKKEEKRKEQEEKRQAREEKKAEKEREEQKKADKKAKQTSMFTSFFKKPAAPAPPPPEVCVAGPSTTLNKESDFAKAFPLPQARNNVEWAPINRFSAKMANTASQDPDVSGWTQKDFLRDHLERHKKRRQNPRSGRGRGLKSEPLHGTVADKWSQYQEAEDPRMVLEELCDGTKFPWKTLAFDRQLRPPYVGTFTKKSLSVGPRTPFAQDPVFDYSYDSGDDWQEEEEGGDDVDQPVEEEGDDEAPTEDEGEFDDWLDDSEDPVFAKDAGPDGDITMAEPTAASSPKKKVPVKRITKLTPTWQGPVWERVIAEPTEGLDEFRIQLLNDTPTSINPFSYQSSDPLPQFKTSYSDTAIGNQLRVRCLLSAKTTNAPDYAPARPAMPLGDGSAAANKPVLKVKSKAPKVGFPARQLPEFLRIVDGNNRILTDLISHLKIRFDKVTTKAAIEAKIREVAVREGKSKDSVWRVKPEAWAAAGITPPSASVPVPVPAPGTAGVDGTGV